MAAIPGADIMVQKLTQQLKETTAEKLDAEAKLTKLKAVATKAFGEFNDIRVKYDNEKKKNAESRALVEGAAADRTKLANAQATLAKIVSVSKVAFKEFNELKEQYEIAVFTRQEAEKYAAELLEHIKQLQAHSEETAKHRLSVNNSAFAEEVQKLVVAVQAEKDAKIKLETALREANDSSNAQIEHLKTNVALLQQRLEETQATHLQQLKQQQQESAAALAEAARSAASAAQGSVTEVFQRETAALRSDLLAEQQLRQQAEARATFAEASANNDRIVELERQVAMMKDLLERSDEKLSRAEERAEEAERRVAEVSAARAAAIDPEASSVQGVLSAVAGIPPPPPPPLPPTYNPMDRPTLRLKKRSQMSILTGQAVEVAVDPRAEAFSEMINRIKSGAVLLKKTSHQAAPAVASGQMSQLASMLSLKSTDGPHSSAGSKPSGHIPINDELAAKLKRVRPTSVHEPSPAAVAAALIATPVPAPATLPKPSASAVVAAVEQPAPVVPVAIQIEATAIPDSAIEMAALLESDATNDAISESASKTASFEGAPTSDVDYDMLFANIEEQLKSFS
ncbi:hypothetical protein CAOG_05014 [Capsaspora owczarzaki ATCC 30864]|uniref:Uncharacterized protein n=1 Tax=Capsaspora owczarzaki (strain ATCC 30864) TaxID=595528 RepID=A0A0D2X3I3_CAPO3|nr:hypothetical protein CAOG_05014 [Capsaspora owczarzaki ATCC 30864]KJE94359.1 hypothetical protein CAOG_005014 [Capsaspora owczarzaki ATCC 30864]|eukprot:XP_004346699.1 hypothetical protein CAOG_05014 [Capsaspora owczarzaki ATCC 30864]